MREVQILHQMLAQQCPQIHKKRLSSLIVATQSLLDGDSLSLTELGRNIEGRVAPKHNIKRMDRLLGNHHLNNERLAVYQWHARQLCGANPMPVVLVDWADVREQLRMMTLRASVSVKGRSITLYERTFEFKDYNAPRSHNLFLKELSCILPDGCTPLIVTDAGYRNTWFREVASYGWYWLGRLRGEVCYQLGKQWQLTKTLYDSANSKARYIGAVQIAKKKPMPCQLYLFKSKDKQRKDKRSRRSGNNHSAKKLYHRSAKEPWVLATNLPPALFNSVQVTKLYAKRMQIEETFRDLKSPQYGFGLRHSRSRCPRRYDVLLLIAMLAEIMLWWLGLVAQQIGWQRHFQANTIRKRAVLSVVRLGKEVRRRPDFVISEQRIRWAMNEFLRLVHTAGLGDL
ncbi:IS4 family transposase [Corallincola holothuriorum]|uniref:IS4 family transposase n=1 Tax=Corallincola holothuriorum TaxID=2282215 RepID=A0A368NM96_9GAMM|nr:IS4 family transposase [Corallincola holothuriorum]RCU50569.1 IS4 family transposase [Corallincola holothuriorum]